MQFQLPHLHIRGTWSGLNGSRLLAVVPDISRELPVGSDLLPHYDVFSDDLPRAGPLVLRLNVPISRAAEGPSALTSRVESFGSPTCSAMLFHIVPIAALPCTMPEPGGNAVASSV